MDRLLWGVLGGISIVKTAHYTHFFSVDPTLPPCQGNKSLNPVRAARNRDHPATSAKTRFGPTCPTPTAGACNLRRWPLPLQPKSLAGPFLLSLAFITAAHSSRSACLRIHGQSYLVTIVNHT
jgi:hypothetical protein